MSENVWYLSSLLALLHLTDDLQFWPCSCKGQKFLNIVWPKNFKMYHNIQSSGCFNFKEYLCFFKNVMNIDRNTANALHNSKGILTLFAA